MNNLLYLVSGITILIYYLGNFLKKKPSYPPLRFCAILIAIFLILHSLEAI